MPLHIIKLVVGCDNIDELVAWHAEADRPWIMHTRMTPKRVDEVLAGGSLYRVMKGQIVCRQTILAIDTVGEGRESRCEVTVDPNLVRVVPTPRRPFQGWRYLVNEDVPADLTEGEAADMPLDLARQLRELGAW
jgi:hypothetical protein